MVKKAKKPPKLVEVLWLDSSFNAGWHTHKTYSPPSTCRTVGYLTYKSRKVVNVSMNWAPESRGETMAIPRQCVRSISKLRDAGYYN